MSLRISTSKACSQKSETTGSRDSAAGGVMASSFVESALFLYISPAQRTSSWCDPERHWCLYADRLVCELLLDLAKVPHRVGFVGRIPTNRGK